MGDPRNFSKISFDSLDIDLAKQSLSWMEEAIDMVCETRKEDFKGNILWESTLDNSSRKWLLIWPATKTDLFVSAELYGREWNAFLKGFIFFKFLNL